MKKAIKRLSNNKGMGTVEIILIIVEILTHRYMYI